LLLTITTTAESADDLGHLLHKHPDTVFEREPPLGRAWVFYPEVSSARTTCAMLVEVDPVGMVRRAGGAPTLEQYVSDRPFVASSITAVALKRCFSTAMAGRSTRKQERLEELWPLEARIEALNCASGADGVRGAFEPLGYTVEVETHPLDEAFPAWGESTILSVTLRASVRVRDLLNHLYILLPALDRNKHHWVGRDELEKLLREAGDWLARHPARETLVKGYLRGIRSLARDALAALADDTPSGADDRECEEELEECVVRGAGRDAPSLNQLRLEAVVAELRSRPDVTSVADLGCGEGRLLGLLREDGRFTRLAGMDVSSHAIAAAEKRLGTRRWSAEERQRTSLFQSSLMYRDDRIRGFDAATLVEVIEHVEAGRLGTLERVVFEWARPRVVVVTTPNRAHNAVWADLGSGGLRHGDHRFEWDREQLIEWCRRVQQRFGYTWRTEWIGPAAPGREDVGGPTQMAVFSLGGDGE
jgi:3' terminal RNA ribose 2'-O-methyltransferase Hen1